MTAFNSYKKRREAIVIGPESSPGTTATKQYAFRWLDKGLKSIPMILENESAMGSDVKINDSAIDVWHSEGPLGGKVTEDGIGWLMTAMLNKVTTTAAGAQFKHVFTRDKSFARRTLSVWDVRPVDIRLYKSVYMDNLEVSIEVGEKGAWLEAKTALKGWKRTTATGVTPAFKVGEKEFTSRQVEVFLASDVAGLTAGKIKPRKITLKMEESTTVDHSLGETNDDPEFDSAPAEVKGSMVIKYRKTDFEDDYFANAVHALKIVATNGTSKIEFLGTKVRFRELTDSDSRDDVVTQEVSFYFEADDANAGKDIEVTVTNDVPNYNA
ncbi:phage tail tube protein [Arthrobacter sp. KNU40]|uniref:phage tail tube protein n=1 Tax=Arthrobacter sp. KNU40 TaxID=3447965 RepID=UPI003F629CE0